MIDERHEELASLYALDLLEGAEFAAFEEALASDRELRSLVAQLRTASAQLAHVAPAAEPPAALKQRIDASITAGAAQAVAQGRRGPFAFVPWALAAGFAAITLWLASRDYALRAENRRLADQAALADLTLKSTQAQLESERIVSGKIASDFNALESASKAQVASARETANVARKQTADARAAQQTAETNLGELRQAQASLVAQLTAAERAETAARAELTNLTARMATEGNLSRLKIATLASMLHNSPQALAVAVWDPTQQQGVLTVDKLPASLPGQDYELWVIGDKPVSAGVFSVGADGKVKLTFKPAGAVRTAAKFAVSREKDDGAKAHVTPGEVIMISE